MRSEGGEASPLPLSRIEIGASEFADQTRLLGKHTQVMECRRQVLDPVFGDHDRGNQLGRLIWVLQIAARIAALVHIAKPHRMSRR